MSESLLNAALSYRRRGFSIIPVKPADKRPLVAWEVFQRELASEEQIETWWGEMPQANVGIVTGAVSDCVVLDLDNDEARQKLKDLLSDYDFSAVPRSKTGKGWHLFFKHPGDALPNRVAVLPGLDVRADGGYIVAPPSIHSSGKYYRWEVFLNGELPKLPQQLFTLISSRPTHDGIRERFDTARALAGVTEGQRDTVLFKLAAKLRNADVPQDLAEQLVLEAAKNCEPPFPERSALDKVQRVYQRYAPSSSQPATGVSDAKNQVKLWPEFLTAKEILQAPNDPTRWILENCLPAGGASVFVAKPKAGKSTAAADLSISVARGEPFLGRATQQSPVAYVFLDGPLTDIAETFVKLGLRESDPVFIHAGSAPADAVAWILSTVKNKGARLVIIDVLQKLCRFTDINDYSEVTSKMEPLLEAARTGNCHVMTLHHAKKDSRDDLDASIGSTAIRGLCYTYLFLKRMPESTRRILSSDQRGGKNFDEVGISFDNTTGRLKIDGTIQEVEIEEAEPKIIEFIGSESREVTEREIGHAVPLRAFIISRAIRKLYREGKIERTGKGRRGSPFLYSLAAALADETGTASMASNGTLSFSSSPKDSKSPYILGRESGNLAQGNGNTQEILFPKDRKRVGREWEEKLDKIAPGRETGELKNSVGWEDL